MSMKKLSMEKTQLMRHPWLYSRDGRMDQNHPQSNWQTAMRDNCPYKLEEGFTSYKSAVHLGDDLKSRFILIRLNKSGLERKWTVWVSTLRWWSMESHEDASLRSNRIAISRSNGESVSSWMECIQRIALSRVTRNKHGWLLPPYGWLFNGVQYNSRARLSISNTMGQEDTVITFDLVIYVKAKQIQWRLANEWLRFISYWTFWRLKYLHSGLEDQLIESGVYAAGTTSLLMKGKSDNGGCNCNM